MAKDGFPPKVFISYSWSTPTHESWVVALASRLVEDGIDAVLDKWDLKPGHDSIAFMETMVADPSVTKVLMICDQVYAEKANRRAGGVGTESQILSAELYGSVKQDKIAAAITETDEDGKAPVPIYYKGRVYFDFTTDTNYERAYEELLRWLLDKPLHVKPSLGKAPSHILSRTEGPGNSSTVRRIEHLLQSGSSVLGTVQDFRASFVEGLQKLGKTDDVFEHQDDAFIHQIDAGKAFVDQIVEVTTGICRHDRSQDGFSGLVRLLEDLLVLSETSDGNTYNSEISSDVYQFLTHEIFISILAITLKSERFDLSESLIFHNFPKPIYHGEGRSTASFTQFRFAIESIRRRNVRLGLRRISLHADLILARHENGLLTRDDLMQADLVAYLSDNFKRENPNGGDWWPFTLAFATRRYRPFELFVRAESSRYFNLVAPLFSSGNAQNFRDKVSTLMSSSHGVPRFDYSQPNLIALTNAPNLAATP